MESSIQLTVILKFVAKRQRQIQNIDNWRLATSIAVINAQKHETSGQSGKILENI